MSLFSFHSFLFSYTSVIKMEPAKVQQQNERKKKPEVSEYGP